MIWLGKVWAWLKKNWKYILFPIGILVAIFTLLGKRKQNVVAPELVGAEEKKIKARRKADKKLKKADEERTVTLEEVEKEHSTTIAKLTRAQRDKVKELKEDPDELNSFLLQVGEEIRAKQ